MCFLKQAHRHAITRGKRKRIIPVPNHSNSMPVCPKCKKMISPKKLSRHMKRCGAKPKTTLTYTLP